MGRERVDLTNLKRKQRCDDIQLHLSLFFFFELRFLLSFWIRVSSVASAGRCLRTLPLRIIMRRRAVMTSLRNPLKMYVCGVDLSDRDHRMFGLPPLPTP